MADPLTLSVLASSALSEGIKFLYGQATELLKRRRELKAGKDVSTDPVPVTGAVEFDGALGPLLADQARLAALESELRGLRTELEDFAHEPTLIKSDDRDLLANADALRRLLEAVYQQHITFLGEARPSSGPVVDGSIDVRVVSGYAAAVRARTVGGSARIQATARADEVTGTLLGVDIDRIE